MARLPRKTVRGAHNDPGLLQVRRSREETMVNIGYVERCNLGRLGDLPTCPPRRGLRATTSVRQQHAAPVRYRICDEGLALLNRRKAVAEDVDGLVHILPCPLIPLMPTTVQVIRGQL